MKGKEYDYKTGELIFEGEYLNGIKWNGKGKFYYNNDDLIKKGEIINGELNGNIVECDNYGRLIF